MIWVTPSKFPFLLIVTKGKPSWSSQTHLTRGLPSPKGMGNSHVGWQVLTSSWHPVFVMEMSPQQLQRPGQRLPSPTGVIQNAIALLLSALAWCHWQWCTSQRSLPQMWCPLLSTTPLLTSFLLRLHSFTSFSLRAFSEAESGFCYLILWSTSVSAGTGNSSQFSIFPECHYHIITFFF